eukprot:ANDGO_05491.mRNA.1 hypothetical protein
MSDGGCYPAVGSTEYWLFIFSRLVGCTMLFAGFVAALVNLLRTRKSGVLASNSRGITELDAILLPSVHKLDGFLEDDENAALELPVVNVAFPTQLAVHSFGFWWTLAPEYQKSVKWVTRSIAIFIVVLLAVLIAYDVVMFGMRTNSSSSNRPGSSTSLNGFADSVMTSLSLIASFFCWKYYDALGILLHCALPSPDPHSYANLHSLVRRQTIVWLLWMLVSAAVDTQFVAAAACDASSSAMLGTLHFFFVLGVEGLVTASMLLCPWMCRVLSLQLASVTRDLFLVATGESPINGSIRSAKDAVNSVINIRSTTLAVSTAISVFSVPMFLLFIVHVFRMIVMTLSPAQEDSYGDGTALSNLFSSLVVLVVILVSLWPATEVSKEVFQFTQLIALLASDQFEPSLHRAKFLEEHSSAQAPSSSANRNRMSLQRRSVHHPWFCLLRNERQSRMRSASNSNSNSNSRGKHARSNEFLSDSEISFLQTAVAAAETLFGSGIAVFGYSVTTGSIARVGVALVPIYGFVLQYAWSIH